MYVEPAKARVMLCDKGPPSDQLENRYGVPSEADCPAVTGRGPAAAEMTWFSPVPHENEHGDVHGLPSTIKESPVMGDVVIVVASAAVKFAV
jgi:hypothetical protein